MKPMRNSIVALILTSLVLPIQAQRSDVPPRFVSAAERESASKKSGDSRSLFQRMFGPRPTPTPIPTPIPKATPAPKPKPAIKKRPKPRPADEDTAEPSPKVTPKTRPAPKAAATASTETTTPETAAPSTVKPKVTKGGKKGSAASVDSSGLDDVTRFRNAKAKALEDARIKELKSQADSEVNAAEAHKATVNYNRALFQKIREVDPSVSDYAGKVEQSMTKRIGSENAK